MIPALMLTLNIYAKAHCGEVYTLIQDGKGGYSVKKDEECISTPNDWKEQ